MNTDKPSFGTKRTFVETVPESPEKRTQRPEVGCCWEKYSEAKQMSYMTVQLKFTKEQLENLLITPTDPKDGKINYNLVAFPNKNQENNPRRPAWRLYEELNRNR